MIGPSRETVTDRPSATFHRQRSSTMAQYVVITPVRDEEEFIADTLECVIRHLGSLRLAVSLDPRHPQAEPGFS